tara:strand:- start:23605 stop:24312 length:708 start_codon:yes stop_codon:yes gene_type:complete
MIFRRVRDIEYRLSPGSERKTTDIVIERNGEIIVRAPRGFTPQQVDAVVESKRHWVYRNLAEWKDLNATAVTREWVAGETFLYLGGAYRLKLVSGQDVPLKLKDGRFCLNRETIEKGGVAASRRAFETFYTDKGQVRLSERVALYAPKVGVTPSGVKLKEMGYRWASCGRAGVLNFHWKCMMAPPRVIDYIVVHELCHFHQSDHSQAFWNEIDKVLPDWQERKEWLRCKGAGLDI